ncbi:MAG: nitroreductase/quinone reductase family protein [Chloroflexota bacterium]
METQILLTRLFITLHITLYRLTGGILGGRLAESRTLLLTTTGRKSGQPRTTPLRYLAHGEAYLIVASNWGKANPPAWYLNLQANSTVTIQVMNQRMTALAETAPADQQDALYHQFIAVERRFVDYQKTAGRAIPVVILHPQ